MTLKVNIIGCGPDIVLLHGWAMNSEIWQETANHLAKNYCVHLIDLPGFGINNQLQCDYDLDILSQFLLPSIPNNSIIIGWSMGGLIAMNIALKHKKKVSRLILIACNAQFSASNNWLTAMKSETLLAFGSSLNENYKQTIQRFLFLQARGGDNAKETILALKQRLSQQGEPNKNALYGGLRLLEKISFVEQLCQIQLPILLMFGKLDAIVPVAAANKMLEKLPQAKTHIFLKAAHAPFISHFEEFITELDCFLNEE